MKKTLTERFVLFAVLWLAAFIASAQTPFYASYSWERPQAFQDTTRFNDTIFTASQGNSAEWNEKAYFLGDPRNLATGAELYINDTSRVSAYFQTQRTIFRRLITAENFSSTVPLSSIGAIWDWKNYASQATAGRNSHYGAIGHNYTDGGAMRVDQVGSGTIMTLALGQNSAARPDKPASYVGDGHFMDLIRTNWGTLIRVDSVGNMTFYNVNDTVKPIITAENGIRFSSAVTTDTLQDYNVATFNPTLSNRANFTGGNVLDGRYIQIGKKVTLQFAVQLTPTATGQTTFRFTLPVNRESSNERSIGSCVPYIVMSQGNCWGLVGDAGVGVARFEAKSTALQVVNVQLTYIAE